MDEFAHRAAAPHADTSRLGAAIIAAADAGRVPAADKAVRDELTSYLLGAHWPVLTLDSEVAQRRRDAVVHHSTDILAGWAKVADGAAEAIARAHEVVPDLRLDVTQTLDGASPSALKAWGEAKWGRGALLAIAEAYPLLAAVAGVRDLDEQTTRLVLTDAPAAVLAVLDRGAQPSPYATQRTVLDRMIDARIPLSMAPTLNALTDRIRAYREQQAEEQQQAQQRHDEAVQRAVFGR